MPQFVSTAAQTVAVGQNVLFTATPVKCNKGYVLHREGSGIITLRGITSGQCKARYKVTFDGNIAVAAGGTAAPISLALAIDGEALYSSTAIVTPAAAGDFFHVSMSTYVDVPRSHSVSISVENTSAATAVDVSNANIIITRDA